MRCYADVNDINILLLYVVRCVSVYTHVNAGENDILTAVSETVRLAVTLPAMQVKATY